MPKKDTLKKAAVKSFTEAQGGNCFRCGKPMEKKGDGGALMRPAADHVYPLATVGKMMKHNMVLSHQKCATQYEGKPPLTDDIERARAIYQTLGLEPFTAKPLKPPKPERKRGKKKKKKKGEAAKVEGTSVTSE